MKTINLKDRHGEVRVNDLERKCVVRGQMDQYRGN